MNFAPITAAPLAIQIHLATVVPAFAIGTWLIFGSTKGSTTHRALGVTYLALMTVTAASTVFIRTINPGGFSPVHLFIPLTLYGVFAALWNVRRGNIKGHRSAMLGLYFGGLLIAGAFTLLPGRLMHGVFFG
jgi:uncharacterized membrane protein